MTLRWLLAGLHLLALGVGLGAVWVRGRSLLSRLDERGLHAVFLADMWWGIAAFIWIGTGLWRLLAGLEKDTSYYLHNHLFLTKMDQVAPAGEGRWAPGDRDRPRIGTNQLCASRSRARDGVPGFGYGARVWCPGGLAPV
jgi:hypothetical protein